MNASSHWPGILHRCLLYSNHTTGIESKTLIHKESIYICYEHREISTLKHLCLQFVLPYSFSFTQEQHSQRFLMNTSVWAAQFTPWGMSQCSYNNDSPGTTMTLMGSLQRELF